MFEPSSNKHCKQDKDEEEDVASMWDLIAKTRWEELHRQAQRQRRIGEALDGRAGAMARRRAALGRWSKSPANRRHSILKRNGKLHREEGNWHA